VEKNMETLNKGRRSFLKSALIGSALLASELSPIVSTVRAAMEKSPLKLPPLPYGQNALAPYISPGTMGFHYGLHHKGYVDNVNRLVQGTRWAGASLEEIIKQTVGKAVDAGLFNNAAQVWNHTFYWESMKPGGGGVPSGELAKRMDASFGSFEKFKESFSTAAGDLFGSGWVWLVKAGDTLQILQTSNADTPITQGMVPLLTLDVWEHAYYLDYQNRRRDYINVYLNHLVNWDFAARNLV
jgi:Fe-Mn family superoxide dismutase